MSNTPQHPDRATRLANLWKECITLWRDLVLGFGHPIDLMRWGVMRALEHRALGNWLRNLEALVRRAIESDALTRTVPPPRMHRPRRADKRNGRPASSEDMPRFRATIRDDSTTWRVSFRMSKREYDPTRRRYPRKSREPRERRPCRGFALRIEALRRAINGREDYVMRYSRRLARREEAARVHNPIQLPDPPPRDPPDRRPIHLINETALAPHASAGAGHEIPPWNAKYAEPG